jgi:hypothetical protein
MSVDAVRAVADAVLYEGYILYPYRASAQKNRSRWQFGVVMPAGYGDASEPSFVQSECVLERGTAVTVVLRFLHVRRRTDALSTWDEAVPCEITVTAHAFPHEHEFAVPGGEEAHRRRLPLSGVVTLSAEPLPGPWGARRLRVRVENRTPLPAPGDRAAALPAALVACHTVLQATGGAFISLVDPPEWAADAVAGCVNAGTWPVLAGPPGTRDLMLCAPIILYDHPEIAPESPGDLFDGTEIDEILTLRTLALSDEEKAEARSTDPRAASLIDRIENLTAEQLLGLHGTVRSMRLLSTVDDDFVLVDGRRVARGSRVRLRPGTRRADAQDMFLTGRLAVVEAVLTDVDDRPYLAVTLADDPGADVQRDHGRFRYFGPDEVEPWDAP